MSWLSRVLPWTAEGRQTWIYLLTGLCGPALSAIVIWDMDQIHNWPGVSEQVKLEAYVKLAVLNSVALLIIVLAHACFVSIRAFKIDLKNGTAEVTGDTGGDGNG